MTVEEIFEKMVKHMAEGITFHDEMAQAHEFLGFWGLAKCHLHHSCEEKTGYQRLIYYYATHYFKLLKPEDITKPKLIPDVWYKYTTQAVDVGTKRSTIKELMIKWIEWERSTKKLYQEMRKELEALGEIDAAIEIDEYIRDVSKELSHAEKKLLRMETVGYDMIHIVEWMEDLDHKYTKKLGW